MSEEPPRPDPQKPTKLPIPPFILGVGAILWKFIDVVARIDFILRVEDQTFADVFHAFVSYGWIILTVGSAIWGYLAYKKQESTKEEVGFKATAGMVVSVGILAFLYGVLLAVVATGSIPNVVRGWGPSATGCQMLVDTSRLSTFRDGYYLVGICGVTDMTIDKLQQTGITVSKPFTITPEGVEIFATYSAEMAKIVSQGLTPTAGTATIPGSPPTSGTGVGMTPAPGSLVTVPPMWYQPVLVPKDADVTKITTLGDVKKQGGKILSPAYFE